MINNCYWMHNFIWRNFYYIKFLIEKCYFSTFYLVSKNTKAHFSLKAKLLGFHWTSFLLPENPIDCETYLDYLKDRCQALVKNGNSCGKFLDRLFDNCQGFPFTGGEATCTNNNNDSNNDPILVALPDGTAPALFAIFAAFAAILAFSAFGPTLAGVLGFARRVEENQRKTVDWLSTNIIPQTLDYREPYVNSDYYYDYNYLSPKSIYRD